LLRDVQANRSGLPDLIRFQPDAPGYELIEIKGPGDKLQDNQIRWLAYCAEHGMPVRVCHVSWREPASAPQPPAPAPRAASSEPAP
ncbi:VRR-NUC domain-containing protein, partial [Campylobacter jejuni]|nr:VRR-NUC domain-containing protein [Campylobacter jejuni]